MKLGFNATALCIYKVLKNFLKIEYPPKTIFELGKYIREAYEKLGKGILAKKKQSFSPQKVPSVSK